MGLILLSAEKNFAAGPKFPIKPIQVVVAFAPGGTDVNLRPFIDKMPEYLGQPMTFVYKPGAAGALGAGFVTTSKPDGYTILGSTQSAMVVIPHTQKGVTYTLDAFAPICNLTESYPILWVQSNARWKNLPELVAEAKKKPGMISFTSPGTLAIQHLLVEAFAKEAGIKLNHIPAQGGATVITALAGRPCRHGRAGYRHRLAPCPGRNAPTAGRLQPEAGQGAAECPHDRGTGLSGRYPDALWPGGSQGPAQRHRRSSELRCGKVYEKYKPSLVESYDKLGAEIHFLPPEEYGAELRKQNAFFAKVVKELNQ